ncbi:MAG: UDP-N-acetylmuramoyl-L-alanyl-D-glutamate--2,6-diaminopimelate ligase [Rickettsiales bacterium]|nr:UDP-N-acetylmuramoyl-L-alanyl-D-glutamate--2,6-diaminopimelate ligase [Rickettsiales bacterium]
MKLADLLSRYPAIVTQASPTLALTGLTTDSRATRAGDAFIAISGTVAEGSLYVQDAVARGAVAVMYQQGMQLDVPPSVARVEVQNTRIAAARLAAQFYQPQPTRVIAVTGTDGKSSTVEFIRQLLESTGRAAASIGTIGIKTSVALPAYEAANTTPDPVILHQRLQMLAQAGIQDVALEASSHGLHQYRLEGLQACVGVFTTFGQDHLDYHETLDAYFAAKARLFTQLLTTGSTAVLNADHHRISALRSICEGRGVRVIDFGEHATHCQLLESQAVANGQHVSMLLGGYAWQGLIPLFGRFQVMNVLAASGALLAMGIEPASITAAYASLYGVSGRLQLAAHHPHGMPIFVDYAHTAQGLASALSALRPHTQGKLHVVFGCGGNRDAGKRAEMGLVATQLADAVIVTDDNPRHENPAEIRAAILASAQGAIEVADRGEAIRHAVQSLQTGDVLLIAGKGHEAYQIMGDIKHPFNDVDESQHAVAMMKKAG